MFEINILELKVINKLNIPKSSVNPTICIKPKPNILIWFSFKNSTLINFLLIIKVLNL